MAAPRQKHMLGIEPKMYRHFAVLTVVITGLVGVFSNGYQQQLREDAANPRAKSEKGSWKFWNSEGEAAEKAAGKQTAPPPSGGGGGGGGEVGPVDPSPAGGGGSSLAQPAAPPVRYVVDQKLLSRLSPQQRAAYLRALAAQNGGAAPQPPGIGEPGGPSQRQIDNLVAASRARSGGNGLESGD